MKLWALAAIIVLTACLSQSCSIEPVPNDWEKIQISSGEPLRGICFLNSDTGFVWGGRKNQSGFIKITTDGGSSWKFVWKSSSKCIYTLGFTTTCKGIAGGDSLFMLQSHNRGKSWFFYWLADSVPMHPFNRPAFRSIAGSHEQVFMTAGENFKKGVFYSSNNNGKTWSYEFFPNELTSVAFDNDSTGLVTGNGLLLYLQAAQKFKPQVLPFQGDFWTDATLWNNGFVIASRSGSVYYFQPQTLSLQKIKKTGFLPGDTPALNTITTDHETIIAAGDKGYFCWSSDGGTIWHSSSLPDPHDIRHVEIKNGFIWFAGSGGSLYRLPLQKIKPFR